MMNIKKVLFSFALAAVSFGAAADSISTQASVKGCQANCAVIVEHAGRLLSVAKDANGDMIHVEHLRIPRNAKLAGTTSTTGTVNGGNPSALTTSGDGGSTETRTTTYSGPNGYWVVVTVITYDADGNIVDVQSHTTFFPKNQEY